jgi:hypothetical protein
MSITKAELQIAVATKLHAEMSCMSNQRKAEFVSDIFLYAKILARSRRNFAKNLFYTGKYDLHEILF